MFDAEEGKLLLHHPENAYEEHVRGYFPEVLSVTKCHEDVLQGDGRGHLLRYVATYVDKFSSSIAKDWLNDEASDYAVARRVLFDFHPLEPEMWLNLATHLFPQFSTGGTVWPIVAPE
eukprot:4562216-Karenia_brevis.AAC.1